MVGLYFSNRRLKKSSAILLCSSDSICNESNQPILLWTMQWRFFYNKYNRRYTPLFLFMGCRPNHFLQKQSLPRNVFRYCYKFTWLFILEYCSYYPTNNDHCKYFQYSQYKLRG